MLAMLLREPFCGPMTPEIYDRTPDRRILSAYFAPRDDDFQLITLRQRRVSSIEGGSGDPRQAGRELPSREELAVPIEAWQAAPDIAMTPNGQAYLLMFWQVWRGRQKAGAKTEDGQPITDEYILNRWKAKVARG